MSSALLPVIFAPELLAKVEDFDCGDEPHERELAEWIKTESVTALARGTQVWLYATSEKEIVGFGSLGTSNWNYPDPSAKRLAVAVIPAVAIQKKWWGKPDGPREERYSAQILDHLILEAAKLVLAVPVLGLFVHPANVRACKVYERSGFQAFSRTYTDETTGVTYRSMLRLLSSAAER